MKKILILDKDNVTLRALLLALQRYSDLEVIVAHDRNEISQGLQQLAIDLVITDIEGTESCCFELIEYLNQQFSELPVAVLSVPLSADFESRLGKLRIARRFTKPLKAEETAKKIHQHLTNGAVGQLKGLSLTSVLQLMNVERKNCVLTVQTDTDRGELFLREGEIVAAKTATMRGKDAAYTIISWDEVRIDFLDKNYTVTQEISEPFMALVMEALRLKDEMALPVTSSQLQAQSLENDDIQQQSAPITLIEKQIASLLDPSPGIIEYSLYDHNHNLRLFKSRGQQPVKNIQPGLLYDKTHEIAQLLNAGSFKHMVVNDANGVRHVFFTFKDVFITVGLRREQSVKKFLQQFKAKFEAPVRF
ncbi:DUF4388 domain-containing protein [uncultured Desulfuromonas sp.]|uniref:DUF4388 domain-containing protein n=1 Tax=uncultured Desulfuromonas sp. TaxID=181013 RepID=UPI002AAA6F22|nr:DUF4388 domain-containing protein [uncultured Desulfuromonas sp.]